MHREKEMLGKQQRANKSRARVRRAHVHTLAIIAVVITACACGWSVGAQMTTALLSCPFMLRRSSQSRSGPDGCRWKHNVGRHSHCAASLCRLLCFSTVFSLYERSTHRSPLSLANGVRMRQKGACAFAGMRCVPVRARE